MVTCGTPGSKPTPLLVERPEQPRQAMSPNGASSYAERCFGLIKTGYSAEKCGYAKKS